MNLPEVNYHNWAVTAICLLLAPVTILGSIGNIVNIKTFIRLGISDGVYISLLSLALADLLYLISLFIISVCWMLQCVEELSSYKVWFPVDPDAIYMAFSSIRSGFYAISMLVTTFITVVRCLAVANPLKYRNLMLLKTTGFIILLFTFLSVSFSVLLLAFMGILPQFDSKTNTTRQGLWLSPKRAVIKNVIFAIRDVIIPLASQVIVGISAVIMAKYLQRASQFRQNFTENISLKTVGDFSAKRMSSGVNKKLSTSKAVGKELRVVQQMLLIAVVYSLCNMPKVIFNLTQIILPDFYRGGRYYAFFKTCNVIRELIQSVNSSVTIFIYRKYNSKFRSHFSCLK